MDSLQTCEHRPVLVLQQLQRVCEESCSEVERERERKREKVADLKKQFGGGGGGGGGHLPPSQENETYQHIQIFLRATASPLDKDGD